MAHLIDKSALVAEIERLVNNYDKALDYEAALEDVRNFLNTLEVKEIGIDIPNIDNLLEEDGIDPNSKEAKIFKESYYLVLEKLKGEEI